MKLIIEKFDALICLGGSLPTYAIINQFNDLPIYAADGTANQLLDMNITPSKIIGDFDSLLIEKLPLNFDKTKLIKIEEQDTNDFEKILLHFNQNQYKNIIIMGFHGGDVEHSFNNLSILLKYHQKYNFCIYENQRYGLPVHKKIMCKVNVNEKVSILPTPKVKLKTKGLLWALDNEYLEIGVREGMSNVATHSEIEIEISEGLALVFVQANTPYVPMIYTLD